MQGWSELHVRDSCIIYGSGLCYPLLDEPSVLVQRTALTRQFHPIPLVSTELRLEDTKTKLSSLVCPGECSQESLSCAWDGIPGLGEWKCCQCPPVPLHCHLSQQQSAPALPGQAGLEWPEVPS